LVNLDLEDASATCKWLGSAGYVAKAILTQPMAHRFSDEDMLRMSAGSSGWEPHHLTDSIRRFVKATHDAVLELMTLDKKAFARAIRSAYEFAEHQVETGRVRTATISRNEISP
jgi:hypothetical protein